MKSPAAQRPSGAGTPHEKVVGAQKRKSQKKRILSLPASTPGCVPLILRTLPNPPCVGSESRFRTFVPATQLEFFRDPFYTEPTGRNLSMYRNHSMSSLFFNMLPGAGGMRTNRAGGCGGTGKIPRANPGNRVEGRRDSIRPQHRCPTDRRRPSRRRESRSQHLSRLRADGRLSES